MDAIISKNYVQELRSKLSRGNVITKIDQSQHFHPFVLATNISIGWRLWRIFKN